MDLILKISTHELTSKPKLANCLPAANPEMPAPTINTFKGYKKNMWYKKLNKTTQINVPLV